MALKKSGLGKGLDAIFAENDTEHGNASLILKIDEIQPNRNQPRKEFNEEALAELADSISLHGIIQPLLVRPVVGEGYQIVAGERRWRAARRVGLLEVPVIVRELTDTEVMELALIENLQRKDLTPLEEALGYQTLIEEFGLTQDEVSKTVGKSRPTITNALRMLFLPEEVLALLKNNGISAGHARTLLGLKNEDNMIPFAELAVTQGLSVRALERMVKKDNETDGKLEKEKKRKPHQITYFREVEVALGSHLNRKVAVGGNEKRGVLQIEFCGEDDLVDLINSLHLND